MAKIERLTINKSDEVAVVVEKMIDSEVEEIVLNIPRFSKLVDSLVNFHLIKREADLLKKKIIIESVDDKVIELAGLAKLEAINPFFVKGKRKFSDIVIKPIKKKVISKIQDSNFKDINPLKIRLPRLPSLRKIVIISGLAAITLILLIVIAKILPHAEINIVRRKSDWQFNDAVLISKSQAELNYLKAVIPGQLFSQIRNFQLAFPASGKKTIEKKAAGIIIIYNAYSSDPQPLVAKTRFLAPDGKVFRLAKGITVPAAKIIEGKIVPSSVEAEVYADSPGEDYNIGPVSHFSIPGFKSTPKYEAFYGESKSSMSGGFIGEVAFPTDSDIKNAEIELKKKLEEILITFMIAQIPAEFKILEGAREISFKDFVVNTEVDQANNFSVFGEAEIKILSFKETDLLEMLLRKIKAEFGLDFEIADYQLLYEQPRVDFEKGTLSFPIKFNSTIARQIDTEELKQKLINKSEQDLRAIIFALPGLESANISLWPFKKTPSKVNKIKITLD